MQEKEYLTCLRFRSEYPSLGNLPMGGILASLVTPNRRVTSGQIFRSEPQHMTDISLLWQPDYDFFLTIHISCIHQSFFGNSMYRFPLNNSSI
jgi:hypothetical protein